MEHHILLILSMKKIYIINNINNGFNLFKTYDEIILVKKGGKVGGLI
jgi:hypothetical protein